MGIEFCPCYLFGLKRLSPGVYGLYGRVNGDLNRAYSIRCLPVVLLPIPPSLRLATVSQLQCWLGPTLDPPVLADSYSSASCGFTAPFPWVLVCTRFCLCLLESGIHLPTVLWKSCGSNSTRTLKNQPIYLGLPSPFARSLGWEVWHESQNLNNNGKTSLLLLFSRLWVTHLTGMVFDLTLLPSHCSFFCVY